MSWKCLWVAVRFWTIPWRGISAETATLGIVSTSLRTCSMTWNISPIRLHDIFRFLKNFLVFFRKMEYTVFAETSCRKMQQVIISQRESPVGCATGLSFWLSCLFRLCRAICWWNLQLHQLWQKLPAVEKHSLFHPLTVVGIGETTQKV